jgi:hypothetical protein
MIKENPEATKQQGAAAVACTDLLGRRCKNCDGDGYVIEEVWRAECTHCDGTGKESPNDRGQR